MPTTDDLWQDIVANDGRVACVEPRGEYSTVAYDKAQVERLAAKIAMRCDYPDADKVCKSVAKKLAAACSFNFAGIMAAYDALEKDDWFVKTCRKSPPGFQIQYVASQFKRRGGRRSWVQPEYEKYITR